jgi:hypothetical protein
MQSSTTDSTTNSSTTNQMTTDSSNSNNSSYGYHNDSLDELKYSNELKSSHDRENNGKVNTPMKVSQSAHEMHKRESEAEVVKKSASSVSAKNSSSGRDHSPKVRCRGTSGSGSNENFSNYFGPCYFN